MRAAQRAAAAVRRKEHGFYVVARRNFNRGVAVATSSLRMASEIVA
jgi:hypothetical protein